MKSRSVSPKNRCGPRARIFCLNAAAAWGAVPSIMQVLMDGTSTASSDPGSLEQWMASVSSPRSVMAFSTARISDALPVPGPLLMI